MIVTIDGPAGTGKSTAARRLAEVLGFELLNTGAMYRAVALACLEQKIAPSDTEAVAAVPLTLTIEFRHQALWLNGRDISHRLQDSDVTEQASLVASNPRVREHLVGLQRRCAEGVNLVTEGRDQGTVVFPEAECKIFLTATAEERTRRRLRELESQGQTISWLSLLNDIQQRDARDESRPVAPLRPASDATIVDTSGLTSDEVVDHLVRLVRERHRTLKSSQSSGD